MDNTQTIPNSPFAPIAQLFLVPGDSDLRTFLDEAHALIKQSPQLVKAVDADLDQHALRKKATRIADANWYENQTATFAGMPKPVKETKPIILQQGRPRTPGYVVLIAMLLRGYLGSGFKSFDVTSLMAESITIYIFFANLGIKMPSRSTLTELVNAISNTTRLLILDAQLKCALRLNLDDFNMMLQDSTHVDSNTSWPTDSQLMVDLVSRLARIGENLPRVKLPAIETKKVRKILRKMVRLNREIEFSKGKKDGKRIRRKNYKKMLRLSKNAHKLMSESIVLLEKAMSTLDICPSQKDLAQRAVDRLNMDLDALVKVHSACETRVIYNKKVPISDKVLSISDPDVGYISKGQRDPVIGYKPQIARSETGFITGLLLPKGNASDSKQLVPMLEEVITHTKISPKVVSVDDGYASADNIKALKKNGIDIISINGAKGRALTETNDWESDVYAEARNKRSAIESLIFTLKDGFDFGEVARRGLNNVYAELIEKALAYNLCLITRLQRTKTSKIPAAA